MIDLALLTSTVPGDDPCGPDLDTKGDADYLNFLASVDAVFPASFFEVRDEEGNVGRFDPKIHDVGAKIEAAKAFLGRTCDLRLLVLIAKLAILDRDLQSFINCIEAIAVVLEQRWDGVHPRAEGGDLAYRRMAVEALDVMPTVVIPLQFSPLVESRRFGTVSYRTLMLARGEIAPRADDAVLDAATVTQVFEQIDLDRLKTVNATYRGLKGSLDRICAIWSEKAGASDLLNLDRVQQVVLGIASALESVVKRRDPSAVENVPEAAATDAVGGSESSNGSPTSSITSVGAAAAVLSGVAKYFSAVEPSTPALLLVRQAEHLLGKSFAEAIHILVPAHAEAATINIGRGWVFDLSVDRMAALAGPSGAQEATTAGTEENVYSVTSRAQALGLLDQVSAFFRNVEPSSPVPFLVDRARELAQRDFLSLLVDVLPSGALRTPDNQNQT
jgi:type VI secretion system protein ImpA